MRKRNMMKKDKVTFKALTPLKAVHEGAIGLYNADMIDELTMREFDELCLSPIRNFKAKEIKQMHLRESKTKCLRKIPSHDHLGFFSEQDPKKVVKYLKFTQEDVASATRIAKASIRYDEKMPPELLTRLLEIAMVCELMAEYFNGDLKKTTLWFNLKNPLLGNISPRDMIRIGRYEKLIGFVRDALSGESP